MVDTLHFETFMQPIHVPGDILPRLYCSGGSGY
jgi:hypothetical protein